MNRYIEESLELPISNKNYCEEEYLEDKDIDNYILDEKEDCEKGYVGTCYANADGCLVGAAIECGEPAKTCSSSYVILGILGLLGYLKIRR